MKRNVVEGDGDGRIGRHRNRLRADTANLDAVAGEICFREGEVRHLFHKIRPARGLCLRQLFLRHRRDRDRNVLHIAADFGRCDGHGFQRRTGNGGRRCRGHMLGQNIFR